jgi:DNA-binding GntR family transcriptional regulator
MVSIDQTSSSALSHQIAAALSDEILAGKYLPGTRILQEDIARKFKASRSPVREALQMLAASGLVKLIAHTGAWIAELSLNECEEMYLIRENIEPLMLRFSLPNLRPEQIIKIEKLAQAMEKNTDPEIFLK